MTTAGDESLAALVARQRPGWSLERAFYTAPEIFERERERLFSRYWILAGHASQLARAGDYFLFEVAGECLILIRDQTGDIRALYNVCRHRGSRVLLEPAGNVAALVCRYHGWRYARDGSLQYAAHMPEDFDPSCFGLRHAQVQVLEGLIFVCPGDAPAAGFGHVAEGLAPFLKLHGTAGARIARRTVFPVAANWKLTVENYLECYHCKIAHREYCGVEIKAERIGDGSPRAMAAYREREAQWRPLAESLGTALPDYGSGDDPRVGGPGAFFGAAYRAPLRDGYASATRDGQPAAPLMGAFTAHDGGETALGAGPFTYMLAYNDYAAWFQFVPRDALHSDLIVTWLVAGTARPGDDYDEERVAWLWTVTSQQDKAIIEANATGVSSPSYRPGPPGLLEQDVVGFRQWYLALMGAPGAVRSAGGSRYFGF